jgi:hypothetical protein
VDKFSRAPKRIVLGLILVIFNLKGIVIKLFWLSAPWLVVHSYVVNRATVTVLDPNSGHMVPSTKK